MASADALFHGCEAETFCMVAAEAAASGIELIVPGAGGAFDQLQSGRGRRFKPGSAAAAAREILALIAARRQGAEPVSDALPRTMQDHFQDLFAHYSRLAEPLRAAA